VYLNELIEFLFQVKIWFQNRRAKERRALKKHEDVIIKEKMDSAASHFGMYSDSLAMTGSCHSSMMGGNMHAMSFPPHSLATSIMSGSPQLPMKFE
jgi:hypothetical protein